MGSSRLELCAPVQHLTFFSPQLQYKLLKLPLRNPLVEESGSRGFLPILPTNHSSLNVRSNLYRGQTWLHILCSRSMHCQSSEDSSQGYRWPPRVPGVQIPGQEQLWKRLFPLHFCRMEECSKSSILMPPAIRTGGLALLSQEAFRVAVQWDLLAWHISLFSSIVSYEKKYPWEVSVNKQCGDSLLWKHFLHSRGLFSGPHSGANKTSRSLQSAILLHSQPVCFICLRKKQCNLPYLGFPMR